jgi:hypothetical protein
LGELDKFRKEFEAYWSSETSRQNPIAARDFICRAVCPKLYGLQVIKLALLITLIGGVSADAYEKQDDPGQGNSTTQLSQGSALSRDANEDDMDGPEAFGVRVGDSNVGSGVAAAYCGDSFPNHRNKKRRDDQVRTRRRDQSHLLLVGVPGTRHVP